MQQKRFKTIWISDIHLGCKDCKAEYLLNFLQSTACETLYIVGDFIDFWSLRRGGRWLDSHSRVLKTIVAKSLKDACIRYIPGNHDEVLRDYVGLRVTGVGNLLAHADNAANTPFTSYPVPPPPLDAPRSLI